MAVKKKLFLISIPFILAYLYFGSIRIPTVLNQVDTSNYLAREHKKSKIPVVLNQDQAINELDPDCQCRHVVPKGVQHHLLEKRSTCSQHATDRGPEQKVISYSFYGPLTSAYFNGIFENLAGVRMYYPDYVMRLYLDRGKAMSDNIENYQKLCQLFCRETNFDLCDVNEIEQYPELSKKFGMVWRFAPMADPLVSEWHCRDLDSRISERELAAVKNWQISNKTYHIMRDNKYHVATIVGCCFGMRSNIKTRTMHQQDFDKMLDFVKHRWQKGLDQSALHAVVWPHARDDMIAHDSYLCSYGHFSSPFNRPWPTQRISGPNFSIPTVDNFVGSNGGRISLQNHGPCPVECRPKNHEEWILC